MKRIILSGANGDIAISMAEILHKDRPNIYLIGTDCHGQWPAKAFFDEVINVPRCDHEKYQSSMRQIIDRFDDVFFVPTSEPELRFFANNADARAALNPLMNESCLIISCMDKLGSMQWLEEIGIQAPKTKMLVDATMEDLPLLAKPRFGAGSRGIEIIKDAEHLEFSQKRRQDDPVAQEFLDVEGQEYTCAILKGHDGDVRTLIMLRDMKGDVTGRMKAVKNDIIENILSKISAHIAPLSAINVQLRLTEKGPMIFEINPRFSSTVKMRHTLGFKDFLWWIECHERKDTSKTDIIYDRMIYRVYSEVLADDR